MEFVAELSCSHNSSFERALQMVDAAANAGATAIKLQTWDKMVVDRSYIIPSGPWTGQNLADLYDQAKTPWEWHAPIFERARSMGLKAFSSVFDLESLAFLESIGCPRYKIASFELTDVRLIGAAAQTGKPIILSTGMASVMEIDRALDAANYDYEPDQITLLKCSSAYPARDHDLNLSAIRELRHAYGLKVGFSDHTLGHLAAVVATAFGATMIEKHLTLSRRDGGLDSGFATEPGEFYEMVHACRIARETMGKPVSGPMPSEMPQHDLRRSLHYAKDLQAGHILTGYGDVTTARPATGMEPHKIIHVIGKTLSGDVKAGEPVRLEDFV